MADTILGGDFTVYYGSENNQQRIEWTGSATGTRTLNELYSALLKLFDEVGQMDDPVPMKAVTPDIYEMINQWFIDDTTVEHLTGGSLSSNGWVSGTDEHVLILGYSASTEFDSADIGRTILGGTTGDAGTILDFNTTRNLVWVRPVDATTGGDEFDDPDEAYTIGAAANGDAVAKCWQEDNGTSFTDLTDAANEGTTENDVICFPATSASNDAFYIGFSQKFSKVVFDRLGGTQGSGGAIAYEYSQGSSTWGTLSGVTDATASTGVFGNATLADGDELTYTVPTDWAQDSVNSSAQLYWIRVRVTSGYTTEPIMAQLWVSGVGAGSFARHGRHGEASSAGESAWAGITSIGAIQDNTKAYIFQEDMDEPAGSFKESKVVATKSTDSWWPQEGHLDILLKTKEADSVVGPRPGATSNAVATFLMRQYSKTFSHFIGTALATSGGNTVVPFSTGDDLDNTSGHRQLITDAATGSWTASDVDKVFREQGNTDNQAIMTSISGTSPDFTIQYYLIRTQEDFANNDVLEDEAATKTLTVAGAPSDVGPAALAGSDPSFGAASIDINNGNGSRPYSITIDPNSNSLGDIYERQKYLTRRGSTTALLGQDGEEYLGNELQVEYSSQSGSFTEGIKIYDQTTNAEGILVADHDDGATGDVILKAVRGTFTAANTLSHSPSASQSLGQVWVFDDSTGTYANETPNAGSPGGADVVLKSDQSDILYVGAAEPFEQLNIDIATAMVIGSATAQWQYWNGSSWTNLESVSGFTDNTTDLTAGTGFLTLVFPPQLDWTALSVNNSSVLYYVRHIIQTANATSPATLDEIQVLDNVTATIDSTRTIVPISGAPMGTFAGGKFFSAPGVVFSPLDSLVAGEDQSYQLVDDNGVTQIPPNVVTITVDNLVSGDSVAIFRRTSNDVNKSQFSLTSTNAKGDATIFVQSTIAADNPTLANSKIRVISDSGQEHRYRYDSYSGTKFTLSPEISGAGDGGSTRTSLIDAGTNFINGEIEVGDLVRNTSDDFFSVVTAVTTNTLTTSDNGTNWDSKNYSINTLVEDYATNTQAYVPILERVADASSENNKLVYSSSIDVRAVVRRSSAATEILPFQQDTSITGSLTVTAIRTEDTIIT